MGRGRRACGTSESPRAGWDTRSTSTTGSSSRRTWRSGSSRRAPTSSPARSRSPTTWRSSAGRDPVTKDARANGARAVVSSGAPLNGIASRFAPSVLALIIATASSLSLLHPGGVDVARGQAKLPRIGVLSWYRANAPQEAGVLQALREQGYVDGQTARIDYKRAEGNSDHAAALATELAEANVDVIVVIATPA